MTKDKLINKVSESTGYGRWEIEHIFNNLIANIALTLQGGEKVSLGDFGTFSTRYRAPRVGRNINTGERIPIPSKYVPAFKAGKYLTASVSPPAREISE